MLYCPQAYNQTEELPIPEAELAIVLAVVCGPNAAAPSLSSSLPAVQLASAAADEEAGLWTEFEDDNLGQVRQCISRLRLSYCVGYRNVFCQPQLSFGLVRLLQEAFETEFDGCMVHLRQSFKLKHIQTNHLHTQSLVFCLQPVKAPT